MLTAIVLICSLSVTPELRDCSRDNATNVLQVPEEFMLPSQSIGQDIAQEERVKVMCVRQMIVGRRVI
jgi:hypothetical protein